MCRLYPLATILYACFLLALGVTAPRPEKDICRCTRGPAHFALLPVSILRPTLRALSGTQVNDRVAICLDRTRQLFDSGDTLALIREQDCVYETDDLGGQYDRSNRDDHGGRR